MNHPQTKQKDIIMKTFKKTLLLVASFGMAGLLSSCQAPATPQSAVTCSKCHTIHLMVPSVSAAPGNKGMVTLRHADSMSCPDCQNQVVAMLKTGSLTKHVCKSCGGTLHHCKH